MMMSHDEQESIESLSLLNVVRSFRYWPRIFQLLWKVSAKDLICFSILNLIQGFLPALSIMATQQLINNITSTQEKILGAFLFFIAVSIFFGAVSIYQSYFESLYQAKLSNYTNVIIMEKASRLTLADFENSQVQDQLKRVQTDSGYRPFQITKQIFGIASNLISLVSMISIIMIWNWWAALLLILIPVISFFSFLRIGRQEFVIQWKRAPKSRSAWYLSYLLTRDNSFKEVKLYTLGSYFVKQYRKICEDFFAEDKLLAGKRLKYSAVYKLIDNLSSYSVIFLAVISAYRGQLPIGNVVGIFQSISQVQGRSDSIVQQVLGLCQNNLFLEQLFSFLDIDSTERERLQQRSEIKEINKIEFRDVSFRYQGKQQYALKNINFTLEQGQTVAIVGHNGSGKSTLIKILLQLYAQTKGQILINDLPIQEINDVSYQKRVGAVFQDFVQYEMPVRQNIGYGNIGEVDNDQRIAEAASYAGIDTLIENLPNKLDTQLGRWFEHGHQLSGGQWQRIAIARAFMRDADVYILDEPSSFLDPEAERDVFERFHDLIKNRIGIFISHRLSSVNFADQIWVMEEGEIVEMGTHAELMARNQTYARLYRLQADAYSTNVSAV
ncbi:ABC transporter ATP-binding protein [Paenibacillus donghaensis]|uniref:ABC transporter ATP-binding protein n=1 Tax=Paenibacillus donghaensis TaxID=414771 RepID=UPI00188333E2|nr:ABC transporter ATP-binding protein [Paenibacillus donghaensis]MBE9916048.1 ABC transporter ATP-binding protein [Paenibacillus donghaensis]